jgi:hypothetical protein
MSWHYLRVQEEESLQDVCSGGEQCAPLKSKITHAEFYCNGKLMDSYLDSLSGTTFAHSMESLGEEKSMSSQAVFHARTLVPQEKAQDLTESVQDFGEKWQGSFAKYDPATHSLRTPQCSLFEDSTEFCAILPKWGLMLNGELWEQQTLVQSTRGIESGLSPNLPPPLEMAYTNNTKRRRQLRRLWSVQKCNQEWNTYSTFNQPEPVRMVDGVAYRLDRLSACGNGQVAFCAATAWKLLSERI